MCSPYLSARMRWPSGRRLQRDWRCTDHSSHRPGLDGLIAGDLALATRPDGKPLPGVAQVAMQGGTYAAKAIRARLKGKPAPPPFRYFDKGDMAVIGRGSAVADIGLIKASGFFAWIFWLFLHIFWLIGFRNRLGVMIEWAWSYVTMQRGVRLITGERLWPRS